MSRYYYACKQESYNPGDLVVYRFASRADRDLWCKGGNPYLCQQGSRQPLVSSHWRVREALRRLADEGERSGCLVTARPAVTVCNIRVADWRDAVRWDSPSGCIELHNDNVVDPNDVYDVYAILCD